MDGMSAYQISQPLRGETHLEAYGSLEFEYAPGVVEPADDKEAALLELLLTNGLVSVPAAKKSKSASKPDTAPEEE